MNVWTILLGLLILSVLVTVHELGHYMVGRLFKFNIREFAVGMGPKLLYKKSKKSGITYSLRAFPIGGMCDFGEDKTEDDDQKSQDDGFATSHDPAYFDNKPWWQRALVLVAGVAMNFLLAIILAVVLLTIYGQKDSSKKIIVSVEQGGPAQLCGIMPNDQVLSINGIEITTDDGFTQALQQRNDQADMVVLRDGQQLNIHLSNLYDAKKQCNYLGITYTSGQRHYTFFESVAEAPKYCFEMVKLVYESLFMLITGSVSVREVSGPVGIMQVMGAIIPQGLEIALVLIILISVNLGVMNLLPLPALDGGRLLLVIVEGITKKRMPKKAEAIVHFVGFCLLIVLILLATYNDISNCIGGRLP